MNNGLDKLGAEYAHKIEIYKSEIDINRGNIKRNDKLIVDLQQRNELTQNAMIETQKKVAKTDNKNAQMEIHRAEISAQRDVCMSGTAGYAEKVQELARKQ